MDIQRTGGISYIHLGRFFIIIYLCLEYILEKFLKKYVVLSRLLQFTHFLIFFKRLFRNSIEYLRNSFIVIPLKISLENPPSACRRNLLKNPLWFPPEIAPWISCRNYSRNLVWKSTKVSSSNSFSGFSRNTSSRNFSRDFFRYSLLNFLLNFFQ